MIHALFCHAAKSRIAVELSKTTTPRRHKKNPLAQRLKIRLCRNKTKTITSLAQDHHHCRRSLRCAVRNSERRPEISFCNVALTSRPSLRVRSISFRTFHNSSDLIMKRDVSNSGHRCNSSFFLMCKFARAIFES